MAFDIGYILSQWEAAGIFEFVFPFLLAFALVFGVLQKINLFGNSSKKLNIVVGFVVGLMAIRFPFVRDIFGDFVARGAVGVLILIMMLILISMFLSEDPANGVRKGWYIGFSVVGAVIFIVILVQSFERYGGYSFGGYFGGDLIGWIVGAVLLIGIIVAIATAEGAAPAGGGGRHP